MDKEFLIELIRNNDFSAFQISEIALGLENKLSREQVLLYANSNFFFSQMIQIRLGLENGLSKEQLEMYADPKFNADQMYQIRFALEEGLSCEEVEFFATPNFKSDEMREIHKLIHKKKQREANCGNKWKNSVPKGILEDLTEEQQQEVIELSV